MTKTRGGSEKRTGPPTGAARAGGKAPAPRQGEATQTDDCCQSILDSLGDAIHVVDPDLHFVFINQRFLEWNQELRLSTTIEGKDIFQVFPFLPERVRDEYARTFRTGETLVTEEYLQVEGRFMHTETRKIPVIRDGRVIQVITAIRDVTSRREAEEKLLESEERHRTLFESANDAIFMMKGDVFYECNAQTLKLFNCSREEIIGKTITSVSPAAQPDGRRSKEKAREKIDLALQGLPQRFEWLHKRLSGELFDAEVSLNRLDLEGEAFVQAIIHDITERKRGEEFLAALNRAALSIARLFTLDEIFAAAVDELQKLGLSCALFPIDEARAAVNTRYLSFEPALLRRLEELAEMRHEEFSIPLGQVDIFEQAVTERRALFSGNTARISEQAVPRGLGRLAKTIVTLLKVHKVIVAPLIVEDRVTGLLTVNSDDLMEKDVAVVTAFASLISAAWRKVQLFERAQQEIAERQQAENAARRRAEELETLARISTSMRVARNRNEIFSIILDQVCLLFQAGGGAIAMNADAGGGSIIEMGRGDWEGWTGMPIPPGDRVNASILATGQPYRTDRAHAGCPTGDPAGFGRLNAVACVPLIAREQTIGALWLGRTSPISDADMRLLAAIGDMAASAIYRQSLHEDLQVQLEELHKTQDWLLQSEKLAAIGELVSGVAHELNNPLTSVILYSQLIDQEGLGEEARANLGKVTFEALRAGKIVRGLLDFARQRPLNPERVQLNDVVRSSLELVSYELRAHNIQVETRLAEPLPLVLADGHQVQQVLVNIIQNARQAMSMGHGGGRLEVTTAEGPSQYAAPQEDQGRVVRVCLRDDGPGIAPEDMGRIFDPFFTTKPDGSGTGLGLSICHGIISKHDGHIWAESPPGEGARFIIELPVAPSGGSRKDARASGRAAAAPGTGARVLIIDDEPNIQEVLAQALRRRGHRVDTAGNATDGMLRIADLKYDAILCDIRMPEFSGLEFYRRVEEWQPQQAKNIVFITGDSASQATLAFIEQYNVRYLMKPFELADLLRVIDEVCSKP